MGDSQQVVWPAAKIKLLLAAFDFCLARLSKQGANPLAAAQHAQYSHLRGLFAQAAKSGGDVALSIDPAAKGLIESAVAMYVAGLQKGA